MEGRNGSKTHPTKCLSQTVEKIQRQRRTRCPNMDIIKRLHNEPLLRRQKLEQQRDEFNALVDERANALHRGKSTTKSWEAFGPQEYKMRLAHLEYRRQAAADTEELQLSRKRVAHKASSCPNTVDIETRKQVFNRLYEDASHRKLRLEKERGKKIEEEQASMAPEIKLSWEKVKAIVPGFLSEKQKDIKDGIRRMRMKKELEKGITDEKCENKKRGKHGKTSSSTSSSDKSPHSCYSPSERFTNSICAPKKYALSPQAMAARQAHNALTASVSSVDDQDQERFHINTANLEMPPLTWPHFFMDVATTTRSRSESSPSSSSSSRHSRPLPDEQRNSYESDKKITFRDSLFPDPGFTPPDKINTVYFSPHSPDHLSSSDDETASFFSSSFTSPPPIHENCVEEAETSAKQKTDARGEG